MTRARVFLWGLTVGFCAVFFAVTVLLLVNGSFWGALLSVLVGIFMLEKSHEIADPSRNRRIERKKDKDG